MLAPLRDNRAKTSTSRTRWLEAPVAGWNAKNDLSDMEDGDAIVLDNMITTEMGVKLREGYTSWLTGAGGQIQSLMEYAGIDGSVELFAANATDIYDATSQGAVGAAVQTGLGSGKWQHSMFSTAGGNFLVAANGVDSVRNYDGTTWTTPAITNVTSANLITVTVHQSRLWFCEKNTLKIWYLPATSIAGAATAIDFGPVSRLGGYLVGMATWTRDGGAGIDDVAVFLTSKGEAHVYSGTDPASSTTWERVGTFNVPEPVGRRCFVKSGSDVGILTSQGLVPLSNVLPIAQSTVSRVAATERIGGAFQIAYGGAKNLHGWQTMEYPKAAIAIVNVPHVDATTYYQYVVSTTKGGWSRWTNIPAVCWSLMGDRLFFGGNDGNVYEFTGNNDNGDVIDGVCVHAFTDLGTTRMKAFKRLRPQFYGPVGNRPTVGVRLDYDETEITYSGVATEQTGPPWDLSPWDTTDWGVASISNAWWQSITGAGFCVAVVIRISSAEAVTYNGCRIMYAEGGEV